MTDQTIQSNASDTTDPAPKTPAKKQARRKGALTTPLKRAVEWAPDATPTPSSSHVLQTTPLLQAAQPPGVVAPEEGNVATNGHNAPPAASPAASPAMHAYGASPFATVLTKYERTKIVGMRAEQISRGAQAFVDIPPGVPFDPVEVAERELMSRRTPMIVVRTMPEGKQTMLRLQDVTELMRDM